MQTVPRARDTRFYASICLRMLLAKFPRGRRSLGVKCRRIFSERVIWSVWCAWIKWKCVRARSVWGMGGHWRRQRAPRPPAAAVSSAKCFAMWKCRIVPRIVFPVYFHGVAPARLELFDWEEFLSFVLTFREWVVNYLRASRDHLVLMNFRFYLLRFGCVVQLPELNFLCVRLTILPFRIV